MSNGGFMTLTYACAHPEKLAAAGSVTGGLDVGLQARCAGGLPVALVYGDEDPLVPFAGGAMKDDRGVIAAGPDAARFFAAHNGCAAAPVTTALPDPAPDDGTTVERSDFCAGPGNEVSLWVVHGGGHAWPGGQAYLGERFVGRTSRSLDASEALWAFFKRHVRAAVGAQKT
jgi:polyhydroxybutyrate depolymerase